MIYPYKCGCGRAPKSAHCYKSTSRQALVSVVSKYIRDLPQSAYRVASQKWGNLCISNRGEHEMSFYFQSKGFFKINITNRTTPVYNRNILLIKKRRMYCNSMSFVSESERIDIILEQD